MFATLAAVFGFSHHEIMDLDQFQIKAYLDRAQFWAKLKFGLVDK